MPKEKIVKWLRYLYNPIFLTICILTAKWEKIDTVIV